jgi:hypothetical protein
MRENGKSATLVQNSLREKVFINLTDKKLLTGNLFDKKLLTWLTRLAGQQPNISQVARQQELNLCLLLWPFNNPFSTVVLYNYNNKPKRVQLYWPLTHLEIKKKINKAKNMADMMILGYWSFQRWI